MVNVAIVSALEQELAPLREILAPDGSWETGDGDVFLNRGLGLAVRTGVLGVGKVNAAYRTAEILLDFAPELVINVGYAGGIKDGARGGDIVIGNDYRQVDFRALVSGCEPGVVPFARPFVIPEQFIALLEQKSRELRYPCHVGRIATGDFFLCDSGVKRQIALDFSPVAFDMESAAIAHVCAEKGTAFASVRTLSDLADDRAEKAVRELRTGGADGIEQRPVRLVLSALREYPRFSA